MNIPLLNKESMPCSPGCHTPEERRELELANELKKSIPKCKIAAFCDETAYPDQAREVIRAKQTRKTDAFFYASVTAEYLTAAPDSI